MRLPALLNHAAVAADLAATRDQLRTAHAEAESLRSAADEALALAATANTHARGALDLVEEVTGVRDALDAECADLRSRAAVADAQLAAASPAGVDDRIRMLEERCRRVMADRDRHAADADNYATALQHIAGLAATANNDFDDSAARSALLGACLAWAPQKDRT